LVERKQRGARDHLGDLAIDLGVENAEIHFDLQDERGAGDVTLRCGSLVQARSGLVATLARCARGHRGVPREELGGKSSARRSVPATRQGIVQRRERSTIAVTSHHGDVHESGDQERRW
jgi:hypothetical protein